MKLRFPTKKNVAAAVFTAAMAATMLSAPVNARRLISAKYLGNYPGNKKGTWTESVQGVANTNDSWVFTQKKALWKVPLGIDLNHSKKMWPGRSGFPGVKRVEMPEVLQNQGFDHFGDPDVSGGLIFIPIERKVGTAAIGVFRSQNLSFVDYVLLPNRTRSGWCAINPTTGELFTSHNKIDRNNPIDVYKFDWKRLKKHGDLKFLRRRNFKLTGIPQKYNGGLSTYIQGGDFSSDGKYLFLLNGRIATNGKNLKVHGTHGRGIWAFRNDKNASAHYLGKSSQKGDRLRYEYKPALGEEPEGLTYWDTDFHGPNPGKGGQLHALMINGASKAVWLKHYRLNYADR